MRRVSADQQPAAGRRWVTPAIYGVLGLELAVVIVFAATYNALDFRIYMWGGHAVRPTASLPGAGLWPLVYLFAVRGPRVRAGRGAAPGRGPDGWDLVSVVALAYSCARILKIAGYRPTRIMVAGFVAAAMALDPV